MKRWLAVFFLLSCGGNDPAAGLDVGAIDRNADPCQDFYRFACGAYLDANAMIAANGAIVARRNAAFFATEDVERTLLAAPSSPSLPDSQLLRDYDAACLAAGDGSQAHAALDGALTAIGALATLADLPALLASLHGLGVNALFYFGSTRDLTDATQRLPLASTGGFGILTAAWNDPTARVPNAYRAHMNALAALYGAPDAALADAVVRIEKPLAAAALAPDFWRDPNLTFHKMDLASLAALTPHFDWNAYGVSGALDVSEPNFFAALDGILAAASIDDLKRYLRWRTYEAFAGARSDDFVAEEYRFHQGVFYGFSTPLARDEYCLRATDAALPWAMAREYAPHFSDGGAASRQLSRIADQLRATLGAADWLDDATRAQALAKLDAISFAVGAPDAWPSYGATVDRSSYADSQAALDGAIHQQSLAAVGPSPRRTWFMSPETVNAAYSWTENAIDFPAAILQAPLFDRSYGDPINYGAIGAVMGHELTHGFDDMGRKFDASGVLRDWWTPSVEAQFQSRAQCLIDQYGAIQTSAGPIDGTLTLGENIADLGGVRLALAALGSGARGSRGFSGSQLFFLAYAQSWCTVERDEALKTMLLTDVHAPASARVNGVLADVPEFAAAWACAPGSPMAPANRCQIW
jgi:endothelin-converting enzyme/putative endopeptidase